MNPFRHSGSRPAPRGTGPRPGRTWSRWGDRPRAERLGQVGGPDTDSCQPVRIGTSAPSAQVTSKPQPENLSYFKHSNLPERHAASSALVDNDDGKPSVNDTGNGGPQKVVPSLAKGWSHHWRAGGPIPLAKLTPGGPIPLAGDM